MLDIIKCVNNFSRLNCLDRYPMSDSTGYHRLHTYIHVDYIWLSVIHHMHVEYVIES